MLEKEFNLSEKIIPKPNHSWEDELIFIKDIKEFIKKILEEDIKDIEFMVYRKVEGEDVNVMKVDDFIEKFKKRAGEKLT